MKWFIFATFIFAAFIPNTLCQYPIYSADYANVHYQPDGSFSGFSGHSKAELNSKERHKEEVTEKSGLLPQPNSSDIDEHVDITTEKDSEQISFAKIQYQVLKNDKLKTNSSRKDYTQEEDATNIPMVELLAESTTTAFPESNVTTTIQSKEEIKHETVDKFNPNNYEISDLTETNVYYIYHPDGQLQKVVYPVASHEDYVVESSKIIEPIVEPFYSYDPHTFVLQRLRLLQNQ